MAGHNGDGLMDDGGPTITIANIIYHLMQGQQGQNHQTSLFSDKQHPIAIDIILVTDLPDSEVITFYCRP